MDNHARSSQVEITAAIFDFGGVVITWDPFLAVKDRYSREQWDAFVRRSGFAERNVRTDRGESFATMIHEVSLLDPQLGEIYQHYVDNFIHSLDGGPILSTAAVISELKSAGISVFGLTNWSAETYPNAPKVAPIIEELDDIVVSGSERLVKPDPPIFHLALERFGLRAENTVFIDDSEANTATARALGMPAVTFRDGEQLRRELAALGLPVDCFTE